MKRFNPTAWSKKISGSITLEPIQHHLAPIHEFVPIQELLANLKHDRITTWHDRVQFWHILSMWVGMVVLFGFVFYFFSGPSAHLTYTLSQKPVLGLWDNIYFSFVTATTTGFGDVVPVGFFKVLSVMEVMFCLLLLAMVTSKLISIKQDIILTEIYEISFFEKINRLRSSLLLFRQNSTRLIAKVEEGSIQKREIHDMYTLIAPFEDLLSELSPLVNPKSKNLFTKVLDATNTELLLSSITHSFEKLLELIKVLNDKDHEWRREINLSVINRCIELDLSLFDKIQGLHTLDVARTQELLEQNSHVVTQLKDAIRVKTVLDQMP